MGKLAIICVDNEEVILRSLGTQLKRNLGRNYGIELVSSGREAIDICRELEAEGTAIALIISDHTMPEISGDKLLIKLHSIYPKALKILLTGKASADSVGNVVNAGALYRYIAKPWDETDLILTVKEAIRSYKQEKNLVKKSILLQRTNQSLKRSNQKLSKSLELLLATLEAANDGILVLDSEGKIVVFNQHFFDLWQIKPQFMEQNANYIFNLILRRITNSVCCNLREKDDRNNARKHNILKLYNGKILESYFKIQQLGKKEVGLVWIFRDITVREREKAAAKH